MKNYFPLKSEFNKNVLTLISGETIAQFLPILLSPILSRLYMPEDFGMYGLFISISVILGGIASAKYEMAIMLPKKDEDAIQIAVLSFFLVSSVTIISFVSIVFIKYLFPISYLKDIEYWLFGIPVLIFLTGVNNILSYYNNRRKYFKNMRNATIFKSIIISFLQVSIVFFKQGVTGLIIGYIVSIFVGNTILLTAFSDRKNNFPKLKIKKIKSIAYEYRKFPLYILPSSFAGTTHSQLPLFLLPLIDSFKTSGFFLFANKFIHLPTSLFSDSISKVLHQELVERKNKKQKLTPIVISTFKKLVLIGTLFTTIFYFASPFMFTFILGSNWTDSGLIAQKLSFVFFITFIVSPLTVVPFVTLELYILTIWEYLHLVSCASIFFIYYATNINFDVFLFIFIANEILMYVIFLILIFNSVIEYDRKSND